MSSNSAPDSPTGSSPSSPRGSRRRRPSRSRKLFLATIQAQITGTRILAAITFVVLGGSAYFWLAATTGSPVIGIYFAALAAVLAITVYSFLQLMGIFTRQR